MCRHTGVAIPECSCVHCVEDLLRRFQPALLVAPRLALAEPPPAARVAQRRLAA